LILNTLFASAAIVNYFALHSFLGKRKRPGRPSYYTQYPALVNCVKLFIEQSSAEAHLRRRTSTMYTNGVTLRDIVNHVKSTLGISVSRHTIHRLMQPPRRSTHASKLYKGLVNARVPPKRNTKEKAIHPDFHYTCSQVNLVQEMAHLCKENTLAMSVDNKTRSRLVSLQLVAVPIFVLFLW